MSDDEGAGISFCDVIPAKAGIHAANGLCPGCSGEPRTRRGGSGAPRAPLHPLLPTIRGEVSLHSFGEIAKSTGRKPVPLEGLGRGSGGFANVVLVATEPPPLIPPLKGEGDDCEICTPHAFATARPQGMLTHLLGNRTYPCAHYPCIDPRQHAGPRVKAPKCEGGWAKNSPPPRFFGRRQ